MKFFYSIVILSYTLLSYQAYASSGHQVNTHPQDYSAVLQNNPQGLVTIIPKKIEKIFEDIFINNFHVIGENRLPIGEPLRRIESDLIKDFYIEKDSDSKTYKLFSRTSPGEIFTCDKLNDQCFIRTDYHSSITLFYMLKSLYEQLKELAESGHGSLDTYAYLYTNYIFSPEVEGIHNEFFSLSSCIDNTSHFINWPNRISFKLIPNFNYQNKSIDFSPQELRYDNDLEIGTYKSCENIKTNINRCRAVIPSYRLPNQKSLEFKCKAGESIDLNMKIAISTPGGSKQYLESINLSSPQSDSAYTSSYDLGFNIKTSHEDLLELYNKNIKSLISKYNLTAEFNSASIFDLKSFEARDLFKLDIENLKSNINLSTEDNETIKQTEEVLFRALAGPGISIDLFTNLNLLIPQSKQEVSVKFNLDKVYELKYSAILESKRQNTQPSENQVQVNFTL